MNNGVFIQLIHPLLCGVCGFAATAIGSYFFHHHNSYLQMTIGILLFLGANQLMLKFQFNSYNLNGATVTTAAVFLTQMSCIMIWKIHDIGPKWVTGAVCIMLGTLLIKS